MSNELNKHEFIKDIREIISQARSRQECTWNLGKKKDADLPRGFSVRDLDRFSADGH